MNVSKSLIVVAAAMAVAGSGVAQNIGDSPNAGADNTGVAASGGEQVYREICQACHMPDAKGGQGAGNIPALASNPHLADADYPLNMVVRGKGGMPAFGDMLEPAQIAGVVAYIRTHFGNSYPGAISVADVTRIASQPPKAQ